MVPPPVSVAAEEEMRVISQWGSREGFLEQTKVFKGWLV